MYLQNNIIYWQHSAHRTSSEAEGVGFHLESKLKTRDNEVEA